MEESDINWPPNGRQQPNKRIARSKTFGHQEGLTRRNSSGQGRQEGLTRSKTFGGQEGYQIAIHEQSFSSAIRQEGSSSVPSFPTQLGQESLIITINSGATNGTSQGEHPSPSPTNGISSSSEICQATSSLNSGTSQGEDQISPSPTNDDYRAQCVPLLQAAMKGDWPAAKTFLEKYPDCVRAFITTGERTALHIAATAQHTTFIKNLLKLMDPADLTILKSKSGFTALHSAAQVGNVRIAKQLVEMNNELLLIPNVSGHTPLIVAAYLRHANMVSYLFSLTSLKQLTDANLIALLCYTIYNDMYDIALKAIPNIATADTECWWKALEILAKKPFAIGNESQLSFWKSFLNSWFKGIYNKALMKTSAHQLVEELWKKVQIPEKQFSSNLVHNIKALIFEAAKVGNVEFILILVRSYPDLIWCQDENQMSVFHFAILHRHESVFNLIYEIGACTESFATYVSVEKEENMLHLAGKLACPERLNIVSGAALQMQRELLWFKEIEKIVPWSYVNMKNKEGKTPKEIFIKEHKDLQTAGEKWMKVTADYCMIVATLIATVIFAAAFTVPGGNNQETRTPIFSKSNWIMVFFISDAIALCSSSTSIVIFLSILTSRYTEEDFLKSLPSKLLFGLATLFISMAGMMVAFIATFFLVYTSAREWAPVVGITSASIPIISFVMLHYELWVDTFLSTYKLRFLFQPYKQRLF